MSATRPATASASVDPTARARVPLIDEFDARRRPLVIAYDPWTRSSASEVVSRAVLVARPGQRTQRQPIDLLWNARFALPAGEYRLELQRSGAGHDDWPLGLQIGRVGPPLERFSSAASSVSLAATRWK